jgi:hypothetical protein
MAGRSLLYGNGLFNVPYLSFLIREVEFNNRLFKVRHTERKYNYLSVVTAENYSSPLEF